jgi:hypothetical protein
VKSENGAVKRSFAGGICSRFVSRETLGDAVAPFSLKLQDFLRLP